MAQTTDPNALVGNARCLACIPDGMKLDVLIWIFTQLAAVTTDPNVLLANSACLACIPEGSKLDVLIWLATQISSTGGGGGGGVPALPDGQIFVGNPANVATPQTMSGEGTLTDTGVFTGTRFASANLALNVPSWSFNHTLGVAPSKVRAVLVCTVNDANSGYQVGDEIDVFGVFNSNTLAPAFTVNANTLQARVQSGEVPSGNEADYVMVHKSGIPTGLASPSAFGNFAMKIYLSA